MVVVLLGDDVRSVRGKIGMEASEYLSPWRLINTKAQKICQRTYGYTPLKQANTLPAITELKDYFIQNDQSEEHQGTRQKILEAFAVDGFAAWIIHNAVKRNNDKYRKAHLAMQSSTPPYPTGTSAKETNTGSAHGSPMGRVMFDPVRNI